MRHRGSPANPQWPDARGEGGRRALGVGGDATETGMEAEAVALISAGNRVLVKKRGPCAPPGNERCGKVGQGKWVRPRPGE